MAVIETWFKQDLQKAVQVKHLEGSLFSGNANGNRIGVIVTNNGAAASLSGTVSGYAVLADGTSVPCTGSLSGNRASVLLPAAAYKPGIVFISIFLTSGSTVTTLAAVAANVQQARTDSQVSPGSVVADWTQTINAAMQSVVTANAANMAVDYGSLTYPVPVGKYTIYNDLLYRCITPIATAESWTASHWTRVRLADDVANLKRALDYSGEESIIQLQGLTYNSYWNIETASAVRTTLSSGWMTYDAYDVTPGQRYKVKACQGNTEKTRIWVITDNNLNIISMAQNHNSASYAEEEFIVPNGGTKLLVTTTSAVGGNYPYAFVYLFNDDVGVVKYTKQNKLETEKEQARNNIDAASVSDIQFENRITSFILRYEYFWNIETNVAVYTAISGANWMASTVVPVNEGEIYTVSGSQGSTHKARIWAVTDDSMNILDMAEDYYGDENWHTETFTVPTGGTKLVMTTRYNVGSPYLYLYKIEKIKDYVIESGKKLKGKKLSLLGDSISAYTGTIPSGNTAYYTGSNSGVTSPDQMWWKILCDKTGMIPLIINGWSGSGINWQTDSSHANIVPMSDDSRCNGLHDGSTTPDIILIAGGVNDYTYAQYAQNEPLAWDGKSVPGYTEPTTGKKVYNSFTEAYVAMIKKLQTNYPNAIVVALSTWFTRRGTDNGYVLTHTVGQNVYTQQNYNDKIRYVAEQMHIPYIDVSNIGFNRNNFYPTYAVDSSTIPTHPNAAGHAVMGKAIAEKIVELVNGYLN